MAKAKTTAFFCKECGYESSKWMGQCPACRGLEYHGGGTGGSHSLRLREKGAASDARSGREPAKPALLSEITSRNRTGYPLDLGNWTGCWGTAL